MMRMKRSRFGWIALMSLAAMIASCATKPMQKEVGQLNLTYTPQSSGPPTGKILGVVSQIVPALAPTPASAQVNNPLAMLILAPQDQPNRQWDGRHELATNYVPRLRLAIGNAFTEILSRRGFNIKGPYTAFDEMTYGEKRDIFLVSTSKLQIDVDKKPTTVACKSDICTDEGEFQVTGELSLELIEPLTQQAVLTKRINLSDFGISRHYIRQLKVENPSLVLAAINSASGPDKLVDNTDKVLVEAVNDFYARAMNKIEALLSRDEIMSHEHDVDQLKGLKRF